jgi:dipeptidyl-peptidase 4
VTYLYPDNEGKRQVFAARVPSSTEAAASSADVIEPFLFVNATKALESTELSLQEQLRRERMRLFTAGVVAYEWDSSSRGDGGRLIIPMSGQILLYDATIADEASRLSILYDGSAGEAVDPQLAPDGLSIAFVINDDLYVQDIPASLISSTGPVLTRLTTNGAKAGITCGLADYIAQEEMDRYVAIKPNSSMESLPMSLPHAFVVLRLRILYCRYRGFWWSPDSRSIAYCEADENAVPEYRILHQGKDDPEHEEVHRYPFAGRMSHLRPSEPLLFP